MQFGSLAKSLAVLAVAAALGSALPAQSLFAQLPEDTRPRAWQDAPQKPGPIQALFMSAGPRIRGAQQTPYVDANGQPVIVPAGYFEQCPGGCPGYAGPACGPDAYGAAECEDGYGGPMSDGGGGLFGHRGHGGNAAYGFTSPYPMGAGGTAPPVGYDLMQDVGMQGFLVDQRGPHYFDLRAEAVTMTPDTTFGPNIAFTSLNVTADEIVLSSRQLDYDWETGFRVMGRYDVCPLTVFEFGYMGIYDFGTSATFVDPNPVDPLTGTGNLFSLFSEFGTNPATVAIQFGPMPETERSIVHSISMDTQLQSAEANFRRYWVGYVPRVSGTLLAGFRYTKLKEDFLFFTSGEAAQLYTTRADNDLLGFQTGADVWIGLMQGVRIGAEAKVGIFNNHYTVDNTIVTDPIDVTPPTLSERFTDNEVALISEASADVVVDILPNWSLRAGYEILFLNSIVLAGENFNTASPYGLPGQAPRVPFVNEQGDNYYHGGHVGIEYIW